MNPEQPTKEQVKAELRRGLAGLLNRQPQPVNLNTVQIPTIVSTAISASDTQVEQKVVSFFPNADATARAVLDAIGGTEDILVVPDGINMQGENKAITMKAGDQIELYRGFVKTAASKHPGVDVGAVTNRVTQNMILVKEKLISGDATEMKGTIWHEHGHVLYDAEETGRVFAHEIRAMAEHLPGAVVAWIKETRKLAYFARFVSEPGMDELEKELEKVLSQEDITNYRRLRDNVERNVPVEKKEQVVAEVTIEVRNLVEGTKEDILAKAGVPDAVIDGELTAGNTVTFANCTWKVESHYPDDGDEPNPAFDTFRLRRLT